ncbi:MAG: hypothetical protein NTY98_13320 [Verrucomicrobia bacterium]|nr:hypothetical protein [Verrucomicrobiota bacterium]
MFEESKIWVTLFLVGLIISFSYYIHYQDTVDDANLALQQSQSRLASMKDLLSVKKKSWNEKERIVNKIKAEAEKNTTLLGAQETLGQRYNKADSDFKFALESMRESVERTRNNAPGTELGEIKLANGKTLLNVKIRKVDESGISFIHADGVGTMPSDQVPENLKEQYDLGPNALVSMIQQAQIALLQEAGTDGTNNLSSLEIPASSPSVGPIAKKITVDDSKIKSIKLRMAELDSRIANYNGLVAQYRTAAQSHQSLAEAAKYRGVPSTRHTENANKNLAQAALLENQKASLVEERGKLAVELDYAIRGK